MTYGITQIFGSDRPFLEVTETEFSDIRSARNRMYDILYVQEKYIYLVENYYELESELLASDFRGMHFPDISFDESHDTIHLFVRRITNLLTTARLYVDQTKQDLKAIAQSDNYLVTEFSERLSSAYDSSFAYRLCEALRNYTQHCGIPFWGVKRGMHRQEREGGHQIAHYLELALDTERLSADDRLKAAVRVELAKVAAPMDLRPLIREYICLIAGVHEWLQLQLTPAMAECTKKMNDAMARYRSFASDPDADGLAIIHYENDARKARHELSTDAADRFSRLIGKYTRISALKSHFVASAPVK